VLRAEGEKTARILTAKGDAEAKLNIATAEAECITVSLSLLELISLHRTQALREAMGASKVRATDYMVAMQYLGALPRLVSGRATTNAVLIPQETVSVCRKNFPVFCHSHVCSAVIGRSSADASSSRVSVAVFGFFSPTSTIAL